MIKLFQLYNEILVNKKGDLKCNSDFAVIQGGFEGGKFISLNKINIEDYIYFISSFKYFKNKINAKKIYNEVLKIYNQSALKKYNDVFNNNFIPQFEWSGGDGGFEEAGYTINFISLFDYRKPDQDSFNIDGIMNVYYYLPETGFNDYINKMRSCFLNIDNNSDAIPPEDNVQKFMDLSNTEDFEDQIKHLKIPFIPQYDFGGNITKQINISTGNRNFSKINNFYTKQNLLDNLNEVGLFLISEKKKSPNLNLKNTDYTLYIIKPDAIYTSHYTNGTGDFKNHYRNPFIIFAKDNENPFDILKHSKPPIKDSYSLLNYYFQIFGGEYEGLVKGEKKIYKMEPFKPQILKYKDVELSRRMFNELKQSKIKGIEEYGDKDYKEKFPELLNKIEKRKF